MKVIKVFSIDSQLAERLREEKNQSGLINSLLYSHFEMSKLKSVAELEKALAIAELKQKHKEEIEIIKNGK